MCVGILFPITNPIEGVIKARKRLKLLKHRVVAAAITSHDPCASLRGVPNNRPQSLRLFADFVVGIQYGEARVLTVKIECSFLSNSPCAVIVLSHKIVYRRKFTYRRARFQYEGIEIYSQNSIDVCCLNQLRDGQVSPIQLVAPRDDFVN